MSKDMNVVLLDGMLNKVRADIRRFPRRTVRNLIDLGAKLARGQNQKKFLGDAQDMLENRRSAYYKAVEDMVSHVDLDSLFTFGKNIGYNSCLVGSRKIREIRDEKGYCVPWALSLILDEERLAHSPQDYEKIIKQGVDQGIFTYILFDRGSDPKLVLPLVGAHKDCAFILFIRDQKLGEGFVSQMHACHNILLAVGDDGYVQENCSILRENKYLYGIYTRYDDSTKDHILDGGWLSDILPGHPQFAFVIPDEDSSPQSKAQVYDYVVATRKGQKYPVFLMDVDQDLLTISEMVLKDRCAVCFDQCGKMHIHGRACPETKCTIFDNSLTDILTQVMPSEE